MNLYQTLSIVLIVESLFAAALEIRRTLQQRHLLRRMEQSDTIILFDPQQVKKEGMRKVA
jgi:hypothetical protein